MVRLPVTSATASSTSGADAPALAVDGNEATSWVASGFPTQWIELDLGQVTSVAKLRLKVNQSPGGATTHHLTGGTTQGSLSPLSTLSGVTQEGEWLEATFAETSLRYVRVETTASPSWVAWAEIEVYGTGGTSSGGAGEVNWLVTDHLGTPRIIADLSGSLAGIKRHDYLPFGEEVGAGVGGRTTGQGYVADNVRQKFTSHERDGETGLDFMQVRYYSNVQGRFTSVDPGNAGASEDDPQSWNGYAYARNNPVLYTDPDGLKFRICGTDGACTSGDYDLWDDDFRSLFSKKKGYKLEGGNIYQNGELIGTYQHLGYDFLQDAFVGELGRRSEPVKTVATVAGVVATAQIALPIFALEAGGGAATITTLGLNEARKRLLRKTINQISRELGYSPSKTVRDALKGKTSLSNISPQEREVAAKFYERVANEVVSGPKALAGRELNLARAKYLREGGRPPVDIHRFEK